MLRFVTSNGSIEATAEDEKRVRGMTNAALFHALNTTDAPDSARKECPWDRMRKDWWPEGLKSTGPALARWLVPHRSDAG